MSAVPLLRLTAAQTAARAAALRPDGRAYIDGQRVDAASGRTFLTMNPATGQTVAQVAFGERRDVDRAVQAARRAFDDGRWSRRAPKERKQVLLRFADLIDKHADELALLETLDVGKPLADARTVDIPKSANMIRWFGELTDKLYDEVAPADPSVLAVIRREPLGVIGCVTPWNFPLYQAAYKLGPVLATGNSLIIKPAEQSPLSTLRVAELALDAGLPSGVLNVVPGNGPVTGAALGRHADVDCLAFTGSTETGRHFLRYAADSNSKRVTVEAGGKSPHIVFADAADLDAVAEAAAWGIFFNQGQVCSAGSRLLVHSAVHDELVEKVLARTRTMRLGDPLDPATQLGAIVDADQMARVLRYVESGQAENARLLTGGQRTREDTGGLFMQPTVFDRVDNSMTIARDEIFGPVLSVIEFEDTEQAVRIANDTVYGLGAGLWTQDIDLALTTAARLRAGQVWVNNYDGADQTVPWGGFKQSGTGRDKSVHAVDEYTASKTTWIQTRTARARP